MLALKVVLVCLLAYGDVVRSLDFVFPPDFSATNEQIVFGIEGDIGDLRPFDSVAKFKPHCYHFKNSEKCEEIFDRMFATVNGRCDYAPRISRRTAEDLQTCRYDILLHLKQRFQYTSYLEIGCFKDEVFNMLRPGMETAIGVDPVMGGTRRMTSDDFFRQNKQSFDLIFIDGDHTAEQTYLDVRNALEVLNPGGTIVMHDCNPPLEKRQILNGNPGGAYNGDVWKVAVYLRSRSDVEIVTIDIDHGVGVVRKRPNRHPLPEQLAARLRAHSDDPLKAFTYQDLETHRETLLRLVTVQEFRQWLAEDGSVVNIVTLGA